MINSRRSGINSNERETWKVCPRLKNKLKLAKYVNASVRALTGSLSILSSYHRVPSPTSRTVRSRDHGNRSNSSSGVTAAGTAAARGIIPCLPSTIAYKLPTSPSHILSSTSIALSLLVSLPFRLSERGCVRGAASINGGGRAFTVGFAYRLRLARVVGIIKPTQA